MWEEAYRVAKQHGGQAAANQVAFLWARSLPIDPAIKLLNKFGLLEACIDYACDAYQFDFAFQLCKNLSSKASDVHYKYAVCLEEDSKFAEAETEYILAGRPKEAILMYVQDKNWTHALRIAEAKFPEAVPEVFKAQAETCYTDKNFNEFESLLLRAQAPELIVHKYKTDGHWVDALRVCKDYLPSLLPSLQAEYSRSGHNEEQGSDFETILSRANEWIHAGQYKQAVKCYLQVTSEMVEPALVRRVLVRSAELVHKYIVDKDAVEIVKDLAPRLMELQEYLLAAQVYMSADMVKEAIDAFIVGEDWDRARKIAHGLEPAYEKYVEAKYKESLKKEGNVEQLADIGKIFV